MKNISTSHLGTLLVNTVDPVRHNYSTYTKRELKFDLDLLWERERRSVHRQRNRNGVPRFRSSKKRNCGRSCRYRPTTDIGLYNTSLQHRQHRPVQLQPHYDWSNPRGRSRLKFILSYMSPYNVCHLGPIRVVNDTFEKYCRYRYQLKKYHRYRYRYRNLKVSPIPILDESILWCRRQCYWWHSTAYWWY
jgi:hypothetical protein